MMTWQQISSPYESLLPSNQISCNQGGGSHTFCNVTGAVGPGWYRDSTHLYLRLVNIACYVKSGYKWCENKRSSATPATTTTSMIYSFQNLTLSDMINMYSYEVKVTGCSGCTVQRTFGIKIYFINLY
jgi:hypothetical protein